MRRHRFLILAVGVFGIAAAALAGTQQKQKPAQAKQQKEPQAQSQQARHPDYHQTARMMVNDSAQVKPNEAVLILGDAERIPLMEAIAIEVAKKGAFPHMVLESAKVGERIMTEAPMEFLKQPNKMTLAEIRQADVQIELSASEDPTMFAKVPEERAALARKATEAINETFFTRPIRTVTLGNPQMPTAATAKFYGMPLPEFESQFWKAVNTPQATLAANGSKVRQAFESGRQVHIRTAQGTDLKVTLTGKKVFVTDGQIHETPTDRPAQVWLPAGEVFTAPQPTSANGTVFVPLAEYRGIKIKDLKLTFQAGKVTKIEAAQNAEALKQAIAQSTGDKDLFSFIDIGTNPNNTMFKNSDYCSYTMAGMVTIGIGNAPWAASPNKSDFATSFFIPRATVEIDGKAIVKEGNLAI
jgi:leucyl aminopeptidase (aminopeptidase T)